MPCFTFKAPKKKDKEIFPVAIVKGDDEKFHNKMLYLNTKADCKPEDGEAEIALPMGCMFNIIPTRGDWEHRDIYFIAGQSGSGKSWMATQIANNYKRMYPDRPIYVVSHLDKDNTLDKIKGIIRLDMKALLEEDFDINKWNDCLVIFDDYESEDKKEMKAILKMITSIAIMGRKHHDGQGNISMMVLNHNLTNYNKTKLLHDEASHYVLYPQSTSYHSLQYLLKTRIGMTKDEIRGLKKLGRWVLIHKNYPSYLISSQYAKVLFQD